MSSDTVLAQNDGTGRLRLRLGGEGSGGARTWGNKSRDKFQDQNTE